MASSKAASLCLSVDEGEDPLTQIHYSGRGQDALSYTKALQIELTGLVPSSWTIEGLY